MTTRSIKEPFDFLPVRKSSLWKSYKWVFENHRDILIGNLNMICVSVVKHENFQFEFWNFEKMCHFLARQSLAKAILFLQSMSERSESDKERLSV